MAGGTALEAAPGVVHPSEGRPAVSALLGFVAVPGSELLTPADGSVGPALDDDGVGEAADALGHLAAAVSTDGHDPPSSNPPADHPSRV
jgi:hypothetical protein